MKGKLICYAAFFLSLHVGFAQTYSPITVTGFNRDAFAEAGANAFAVTTTDLDATNHIMYTTDFATTNGITGGVLNTGTIVSGTRTYQLAPFTGNNVLYMSLNGTVANSAASGQLTLATPASYSRISFLSFSTEGTSTLNVSLTFTDGTIFNAGNFTFQDWFSGSNAIYSAFGRIARLTAPFYTVDGLPTNPRWYAADIPISCDNQSKVLQSINISYISQGSTSGRAVVLAVSGVAYAPVTTSSAITPATCGNANGSISVTVSGGTAPLTYTWNTNPPQFTSTASGLTAGPYAVTITDANGCSIIRRDTLQQSSTLMATATASPVAICSGDSATLTATSNGTATYTYTWSPGGQTGASIRVSPADTTTYIVTVQDANGCSTTATVTLPVKKKPIAAFTASPQRFCLGGTDTITFTGTAAGTATYNWNFAGATIVNGSGAGPYTLLFITAGSHIIHLTVSQNGCSSADTMQTVQVDARSLPAFTVLPAAVCSGDTVQVAFTGTAAASATPTWAWGGGTVLSGSGLGPYAVKYSATGTIRLTLTNNSCIDSATSQTVMVTPAPTAAFTPSLTQGCTPQIISFNNSSQNATTYLWSFGDNTTATAQTPPPHTYSSAGNYSVTLTAINGNCRATATAQTIRIVDKPVATFTSTPPASATPLQLSQAQFSFTNTSTGATAYRWYFGDQDSSTTASPVHRYASAGSFRVTLYAYNSLGCFDSISIAPYIILPDSSLQIPNAFSPNGDGINDRWQIPGLQGYANCRVLIFDRYGQQVFASTGYATPWDGRRSGRDVPIGTYYYVIQTSIKNYSGWVFIAR